MADYTEEQRVRIFRMFVGEVGAFLARFAAILCLFILICTPTKGTDGLVLGAVLMSISWQGANIAERWANSQVGPLAERKEG